MHLISGSDTHDCVIRRRVAAGSSGRCMIPNGLRFVQEYGALQMILGKGGGVVAYIITCGHIKFSQRLPCGTFCIYWHATGRTRCCKPLPEHFWHKYRPPHPVMPLLGAARQSLTQLFRCPEPVTTSKSMPWQGGRRETQGCSGDGCFPVFNVNAPVLGVSREPERNAKSLLHYYLYSF